MGKNQKYQEQRIKADLEVAGTVDRGRGCETHSASEGRK